MRRYTTVVVCAGALILTGCKSSSKQRNAEPGTQRTVSATTFPGPGERPSARPVQAVTGRIIAVREALRFVVVDFGAGKMPKLEQKLWAYRLDQKVAELKVSGPYLGTTVAADVVAGEAREGDLVREQ
jgi:hypothetical protein